MVDQSRAEAVLGGGCFWCLEAVYLDLAGVSGVKSGYAGGSSVNPTYEQVCSGRTGHAEVVRITYDPTVLSYEDLLRVFFTIHDPTTPDRQGNDVGTQYRSVIFVADENERTRAIAIRDEIAHRAIWDGPIVTEIMQAVPFYPAEREHDSLFRAQSRRRLLPCRGCAKGRQVPQRVLIAPESALNVTSCS